MCQHMLKEEVMPWRQAHLQEQKEGLKDVLIICAA